jgi:YHS domain-containing protein
MKKMLFALSITLVTGLSALAQKSEIFTESGKAIRGYDPVAYFFKGKAVKGNDDLKYSWKNATWCFSTQQDLDTFKTNPEKFAPQYGGYCAYGLSEGHKATTEPDAWTIVDGKLYLNYNTKVREMWTKERQKRIEEADRKWPEIKNKE